MFFSLITCSLLITERNLFFSIIILSSINHNSTKKEANFKPRRKKIRMEPFSLFPRPVPFDYKSNRYVVSAYKAGFSIKLINNRLIEHDYDSTTSTIEEVLMQVGISPNRYNCSQDSQIWRRYLTYIIETYKPATDADFGAMAYEHNSIYNISLETANQFFSDYKAFQSELSHPVSRAAFLQYVRSSDWIPRAFHVFGSNCEFIENNMRAKNYAASKELIVAIYRTQIAQHMNLFQSSPMLRPREGQPDNDTILFWESARGLRMDMEKIVGDTRIFTGWDTSGYNIMIRTMSSYWNAGGPV